MSSIDRIQMEIGCGWSAGLKRDSAKALEQRWATVYAGHLDKREGIVQDRRGSSMELRKATTMHDFYVEQSVSWPHR